jgi:general secretion pathway protein D
MNNFLTQRQIMKTNKNRKYLGGALALLLCAAMEIHAQQRTGGGGGGGFGGFGGFVGFGGFNNFNRNNASSSTSSEYNNNGSVGNATIYVDPDTKNIIVIADQPTSEQISNVIASLDRPKPQVLINVVFLEVQHNNSLDVGVEGAFGKGIGNNMSGNAANVFGLSGLNTIVTNFSAVGPAMATPALSPSTAGGANGFYQILGSDFQATLRAIASAGKVEVLSRPSILARDGQPATILVGQQVPLITGVSYTAVGNSTIPINNVQYTPVGIQVNVTPYISADGYVEMIVTPQDSEIDPTQTEPIAAGVNAPVIDTRTADTVVVTPDGLPVVIGGLMMNDKTSSTSKIPILGDIPLLGNLFKHKTSSDTKNELMIFLTPHIVRLPSQLPALAVSEQKQMLVPKSFSESELDRFLERVPVKKNP